MTSSVIPAKVENNPIAKKVAKILDSKIETDREIIDALDVAAKFYTDNTLQNRRNLRRDIEHFSLQVNLEFLENFRSVKEELDKISSSINSMDSYCADMTQRLQTTKSQTRELISQTNRLQSETKKIDQRAKVANAFLSIFQLSASESEALRKAKEGDITPEFFTALVRVKEIHLDCKQMLLSGQHTAVLDVMESMATEQEAAFEMLYRWIQSKNGTSIFSEMIKNSMVTGQGEVLSMNSSAECSELMTYAFSSLELRPVLFKYSLDEYCVARRNFVISSFLNALTKESSTGLPKPIELFSHDPLRYINDMLAWIHQSLASEKELAQTLLKNCSPETTEKFTPEALTMITEGLCKPLKVRVAQVIGGEHGPMVLYKLSNLFRFYYITMRLSLLGKAPLLDTINDLCNTLCSLFRTSLSTTTNKLLEKVETPSMDLIPVQGIHHVLLMLKEVLEAHDVVLLPNTDKKDSFEKIFSIVIDASLNTLALTSTELNVVDLAVYMLNCLHLIISVISLFEYTEKRLEMLQAQVDVHVGVLAGEQVGYILQKCGISNVYQSFSQHRASHGPASKINGLDKDTVSSSLKSFESFLTSPENFKLSQCSLISSMKLRDNVHHSTMEILLAAYKVIFDKIWDQKNAFPNPENIVPRSVDDIKSFLFG